jgi:hypothetical protein
MSASIIELLAGCAEFTLGHSEKVNEFVKAELETSSRTPLVNVARLIRLQAAVLSVGMFSMFEATLQDQMGWEKETFEKLNRHLNQNENVELARTFDNYRLAINVLKHGRGRSYSQLLERRRELEFRIKGPDGRFFFEGDVSEVNILVDADDTFVRRCAALIEEVAALIKNTSPNQP